MELMWHDLAMLLRRAPSQVLEMMKMHGSKVFCAGGYVRGVVANEPISDIDLFTTSKDVAAVLARALHNSIGGNKRDWYETQYAYTVHVKRIPIQFIHRWTFETPAECIASFDYTVACGAFWYDLERKKWMTMCDDRFYPDLASKRLVYRSPVRNEDAGGSLLRALKFYQRGYRTPLDSFAKVIARLMQGVNVDNIGRTNISDGGHKLDEQRLGEVILGLLREVDPNTSADHIAYLAAEPKPESEEEAAVANAGGLNG